MFTLWNAKQILDSMKRTQTYSTLAIAALASTVFSASAQTPPAEALINKLVAKGVLTDSEAKELLSEGTQTNQTTSSKWKLSDTIKSIGFAVRKNAFGHQLV